MSRNLYKYLSPSPSSHIKYFLMLHSRGIDKVLTTINNAQLAAAIADGKQQITSRNFFDAQRCVLSYVWGKE